MIPQPASCSITISRIARSPIGISGFGSTDVYGARRVPRPPARMTARVGTCFTLPLAGRDGMTCTATVASRSGPFPLPAPAGMPILPFPFASLVARARSSRQHRLGATPARAVADVARRLMRPVERSTATSLLRRTQIAVQPRMRRSMSIDRRAHVHSIDLASSEEAADERNRRRDRRRRGSRSHARTPVATAR